MKRSLLLVLRGLVLVLMALAPAAGCSSLLGLETDRSLDTTYPIGGYKGCDSRDCDGCSTDYHECICTDLRRTPGRDEYDSAATCFFTTNSPYPGCNAGTPKECDGCSDVLTRCLCENGRSAEQSCIAQAKQAGDGGSEGGTGDGGDGGMAGTCDQFAGGDDCFRCVCDQCETEVIGCLEDPTCFGILNCAGTTDCVLGPIPTPDGTPSSCYQPSTCQGVIDDAGGPTGQAYGMVLDMIACSQNTQCPACAGDCSYPDCSNCADSCEQCKCLGGTTESCSTQCQTGCNTGNTCLDCMCGACAQDYSSCQATPGCLPIVECMAEVGCYGEDCVELGCANVITSYGGTAGMAYERARFLRNCPNAISQCSSSCAPAVCEYPSCNCGSCYDNCLCQLNDAVACSELCGTDCTPGDGCNCGDEVANCVCSTGKVAGCYESAGTCTAPHCDCGSCYDNCVCATGDLTGCQSTCAAGTGSPCVGLTCEPRVYVVDGLISEVSLPCCTAEPACGVDIGDGYCWLTDAPGTLMDTCPTIPGDSETPGVMGCCLPTGVCGFDLTLFGIGCVSAVDFGGTSTTPCDPAGVMPEPGPGPAPAQ